MQIPSFIRGQANKGNKVAQAFIQQYDNGDNETPYNPQAYEAIKQQMSGELDYNGELDGDIETDIEKSQSSKESKATERVEELGDKYKSVGDIDKVKYIKDAYDKGGDEMNKVDSALESRLGADYQMKYEDMNAIPENVLEDIYNDLYGKNNYPDDNEDLYENDLGNEGIANSDEDDAGSPYKETDRQWMKDHIEDNSDASNESIMEDILERFGELSPDDEQYVKGLLKNRNKQSNWYDNLSDESEHAKSYKDDAMKVNPERAQAIIDAMEEYAKEADRGWITPEQIKKYGDKLGLSELSDRDLRLMWDDVHNVGGYYGFGQKDFDKSTKMLDAQSAFAEVVNNEARNRKATGNYFPYNDEDIERGKDDIRSILSRLNGHDLDDAEGYLTHDELDKIERIADTYHLTADDLAKISPHLNPNGFGYRMKGWQSPLNAKLKEFGYSDEEIGKMSKEDLDLARDFFNRFNNPKPRR